MRRNSLLERRVHHAVAPADGDKPDVLFDMLAARPFIVRQPDTQTVPFVFASPHSGRLYPARFLRQSRLSPLNLRRSEDAFVEELFSAVTEIGSPLIAACFPRAFLDANRAPAEIDPAMFDGVLDVAADIVSPRVSAGLGVIPRVVQDGAEIYREKIPPKEAMERLATFYRPYHAALARLVDASRERFGATVLIDCHSMPSAAAAPDIILGDRYGLSAGTLVTRAAEHAFEAHGFRVARNIPYAGGYTTQLHGRPARGVHALQIEINRALYLDEERIERGPHFETIAARLSSALRALVDYCEVPGCFSGVAHAAE